MRKFAVLFVSLGVFFPCMPAMASDTAAGTAPATAADLPIMQWAGIPNPTVGMLWNQNDPNSGRTAGEARQALSGNALSSSNLKCLDGTFAAKVQQMVQGAKAAGFAVPPIRDGYRSPAAQNAISSQNTSVGACQSYHQYGLAVDFEVPETNRGVITPALAWMRAHASDFHIRTIGDPLTGHLNNGKDDPEHFQNEGPLPPRNQCGICDGSGGGTIQPQQAQTPTSGFSNAVRSYMAPQQAAAPAQTSALPASSQPYTYAQPTNTGIANSLGQTTSASGSTTAIPTTIAGGVATPNPVSDRLNSNSPTGTGTSTYDLLSVLAGNTPQATTTATGTPLALNGSLFQVQQLTQTTVPQQYDANGNPIVLNASTTQDISTLGPGGQQTFTSQDLQYSPANTYTPPSNTTVMQRTLETLKQALEKLLGILRPFGYVWSSSTEHGD